MHAHYDRKIITMFGVVGGYFVGHFYNNLYITANNRNKIKDASKSITDEYKNVVKTYMYGVKHNSDYFGKTIKGVHAYYQQQTKYTTISLIEFLDNMLGCFVPEEYFADLKEADKEFFINKIIVGCVMELGTKILTFDKLSMIIDQHSDRDNIRLLQDDMIEIFSDIREQIFNQFTRQLTGKKKVETVDVNIANKLKDLLSATLRGKIKAETELEQSKKMVAALTLRVAELEELATQTHARMQSAQPQAQLQQPQSQPQPTHRQSRRQLVQRQVQQQKPQQQTQPQAQPHELQPNVNDIDEIPSRVSRRRRNGKSKDESTVNTADPFDDSSTPPTIVIEKIKIDDTTDDATDDTIDTNDINMVDNEDNNMDVDDDDEDADDIEDDAEDDDAEDDDAEDDDEDDDGNDDTNDYDPDAQKKLLARRFKS
jgi:DNA primase